MAIQFVDGKILFVSGSVAMHEDCCCGGGTDPCTDCLGAQDDITLSMAGFGTCDDPGPPASDADVGVYVYSEYSGGSHIWVGTNGILSLTCDGTNASLTGDNFWTGGVGNPGIVCTGGDISGTLYLVRQNVENPVSCYMQGAL